MTPTSLRALAQLVSGDVVGDDSLRISGAASLIDASGGEITLVDSNTKSEKLAFSGAQAAVVPRNFPIDTLTMPAIVVDDVHRAFTAIVSYFRPPRVRERIGVSKNCFIHPTAHIAEDVDIHPGVTIDADVRIGAGATIHSGARIMAGCQLADGVTIYPNAVLYENTTVGARSIIHANVVLGCHGFGYRYFEGSHMPSAQLGNVQVGCDCEIGAGTTIDRGTYGPTFVGDGTKIDNLVMIAHNCHIGRHNMICSQVGVAGSTITGDYVVMAGQVGVRDHVKIGDRAILGAKAGVSHDVPAGATVFGTPAIAEKEQKLQFAALSRLPEMRRQLKALQQEVDRLSREQGNSGERAA